MAKDETKPTEDVSADGDAKKPSGSGRGLIIAFILTIILAETAMFFLLVPSAEEVSVMAEQQLIDSIQQTEEKAEQKATEKNEIREFEMGRFGEVFSPHDTEATYRVELDLYGLIRRGDEDKMKAEFADKVGRLRHAIRMRIRNSSLEELRENNLGLLERRILTQCNHLLDEDLLLGIGFKSYQSIEQ